jgi:hypothetical protein
MLNFSVQKDIATTPRKVGGIFNLREKPRLRGVF